MPIKPSSNDRSGYEYYTKRETVEQLIAIYGGIFQDYDYIWLPFNSKGRPIEEVFKRKYKPYKILTTPDSCYNEELGCNDFWEWKKDLDFHRKIKKGGKTLVFDNPPFKGASGVMRHLTEYNFDYILFSDSMTGLNKTKVLGCGYHILGNVLFDNSAPDKRINIGLFSNLFKEIKFVYGIGIDQRDRNGIQYWSERCNIPKYRDERNGQISSAELINVCARGNRGKLGSGGYEFKLNRFDFNEKCEKFGGCAKYNFETDEELKLYNEKHNIENRF